MATRIESIGIKAISHPWLEVAGILGRAGRIARQRKGASGQRIAQWCMLDANQATNRAH